MDKTDKRKRKELKEEVQLRKVFLNQVRERMAKKELSLNRLADFSGINRGYLSQLMRGQKTPTISIVARLSVALECEAWELMRG